MKKRIIICVIIVSVIIAALPLISSVVKYELTSEEIGDQYKHQWMSSDGVLKVEVNSSHDMMSRSIYENGIYTHNGKEIKVALRVARGLFDVTTTPGSTDGDIYSGTMDYDWYFHKFTFTVEPVKSDLCVYSVGDVFEMKQVD